LAWITTMIFAAAPSYLASRADPLQAIRGHAHATPSRSVPAFRGGPVAAEVLLAVVVLTGAGLLIKSFTQVMASPIGFDTRDLISASVEFPASTPYAPEAARQTLRQLEDDLRARLGARPMAFASNMPYSPLY